jgi:hypothetical protein
MNSHKNKPWLIRFIEWLKKTFKIRTYMIEYFFVGSILIVVAIISKKGPIEWLGVAAVFLTFGHASIAERLREREGLRHAKKSPIEVECYWKLPYYFYAKETLWFLYFTLLGAWSALAGTLLFLVYSPWRSYYRKWHPIEENSLHS